eukprot:TRINITY_DN56486_c0_g1_i1.p1 TRINITY_DN56486_c0_g1~~TRINITY_DN56486_c0_g1_i1.p1  ORF type:complete len:248 (+),score=27.94 TRINITY_DN56486_c0_g1_i1:119-862(+)
MWLLVNTLCCSAPERGCKECCDTMRACPPAEPPLPTPLQNPAPEPGDKTLEPVVTSAEVVCDEPTPPTVCRNTCDAGVGSSRGVRTGIYVSAATAVAAHKLDSCETTSLASTRIGTSRSAQSSASSLGSDLTEVQSETKAFSKAMVQGCDMCMLTVDGRLRSCVCSLDRKCRYFSITINQKTLSIPFDRLCEVLQGTEPEDIETPLDELCATFVLENGECLSFRFEDLPKRERFVRCIQKIVDSLTR